MVMVVRKTRGTDEWEMVMVVRPTRGTDECELTTDHSM